MGILPMSRRVILTLHIFISRARRPWDTRAGCPCYFSHIMSQPPRLTQRFAAQPVGFFIADELVLWGVISDLAIQE